MSTIPSDYATQIRRRLDILDDRRESADFAAAIEILSTALRDGGVIQTFGTGHSAAFAMELAGRAGGFIPSHALALTDLVLLGGYDASWLGTPEFERNPEVGQRLYELYDVQPADCFVIASNSGANGSTVELALTAKRHGHRVIAVTSLEHSNRVDSKHPSGRRLFEVADVVIDNLAPYGDATLELGSGPAVGPVSSITAAYIAQQLTLGTALALNAAGSEAPMFLSANIPGGDLHNKALEAKYGARLNPFVSVSTE